MRAGGRTRRRAVDAIVALVVIALVVAVLARARSNDPRRDETRRKSEPRRAGFERGGGGGGGDDAALRRAGTTETGIRERENGKRTVGARGARLGDADAHVLEPRGEGGQGGARKRAVSVELEEGKERRAARDSRDVPRGIRLKSSRRRRGEELEEVPWPVRRSERRRLADPGGDEDGDGDGDGDEDASALVAGNAFSGQSEYFVGSGASCAAACGLCRASCCCDAECRAVGDCCADFEQPGMCVDQKASSQDLGESGGSSEAPPTSLTALVPPPDAFGSDGFGTPPGGPISDQKPPAVPETSFTWPPASPPASPGAPEGRDDGPPPFVVSPPPTPEPPSAYAAAAVWSGPDARDDADDDVSVEKGGVSVAAFVDPRGTWHSDVRPPAPRYPSRPPAPFPPPPGLPPFPLGVYTKLQAVPRCSPFCDTRAPPPSLPRGDRRWPALVAAAAEKQWAQIADLAQIQIGGSAFTSGAGDAVKAWAEHRAESGHETEWGGGQVHTFGGDAETSGTDVHEKNEVGPFFAPSAGAELKRYARRAASVDSVDESEIRAR